VHHIEVKRQMGVGDIAAVSALLDAASAHDGHPALGEHQWLDLVDGGREGFAGLVAWEAGNPQPVGYAQVTRDDRSWALEYSVDPAWRSSPEVANDLVHEASRVVAEAGGGHLHLWRSHPTAETDEVAASVGLRRGRDLLQLRRPLPVEPTPREATALSRNASAARGGAPGLRGGAPALAVRTFEPGRDEDAWLEVNNRAFDWHPEQGGWDLATIKSREAEPWFDPAGFLLHEESDRLAGFCWTKVHADHDPPLGEIYVIAVDPAFGGRGLGRRLTLAGLDHLARQGLKVGMLYVDASNATARALYDHLGFSVNHVDRAYTGDIPSGR